MNRGVKVVLTFWLVTVVVFGFVAGLVWSCNHLSPLASVLTVFFILMSIISVIMYLSEQE